MKRFGKLLALTAIVSVLGVSIPFQSFAASKTISSVTIYAGLEELESGENLPEETAFELKENSKGNYVYTNNSRYEVSSVEWITSGSKEMTIGYEPKMKVELHATDSDEYAFKGGYQSSNVTVKGGTYVSASRSGSDTLYVTFKFKPIKGTYSSPDDAYWKDSGYGGARWNKVDNASDAYDVYLYRGSTVVKKVEGLKATSYNFYPYMTKAGTYSFKVRTVPYTESEKKYGKKSDWTESDEVICRRRRCLTVRDRKAEHQEPPVRLAGSRTAITGISSIRTELTRRTTGPRSMRNGIYLIPTVRCSPDGSREIIYGTI